MTTANAMPAYENWSWVNITIVYLLMLLVYFIPAIFRDSFSQEGKGDIFYKVLYYPCIWLNEGVGMNYLVSVIIGHRTSSCSVLLFLSDSL